MTSVVRPPRILPTAFVILTALALLPAQAAPQSTNAPGRLPEVVERGSGEATLLLIGCMSCRWRTWDTFMERNEERYRMIAVTLPGFGGTPAPDLPRNTADPVWHTNAVASLESVVDSLDLKSFTIIGHSFGAVIAVELAQLVEDRLRAIVFMDAWPTSDRSWFADDRGTRIQRAYGVLADQAHLVSDLDAWQRFNATSARLAIDRRLAYHGWFMATPPEVVLQYWRENHLVDLNPLLGALRVPVLDLKAVPASATDLDAYRTSRRRHFVDNGNPADVRHVFLRDTGHFIHEERPVEIDQLIADFLDGNPLPDTLEPRP